MPLVLDDSQRKHVLLAAGAALAGVLALVYQLARTTDEGIDRATPLKSSRQPGTPSSPLIRPPMVRRSSFSTAGVSVPATRGGDMPQQLVYKHGSVADLVTGTAETTCIVMVVGCGSCMHAPLLSLAVCGRSCCGRRTP